MRHPGKRRAISVAVFVVSVVMFAIALNIFHADTTRNGWFGVIVATFHTGLIALVGVIAYHVTCQRLARLKTEEGLLAKWTVSSNEWQQFRSNEVRRLADGRSNVIKTRAENETSSTNVIITKEALLVGDDFYHLSDMRGLQWLPEKPPCLEFNMRTVTKSGGVSWNIRFPVTEGAEAGARAVWDYVFRPKPVVNPADQARRFRIGRTVSFVISAIGGVVTLFTLQDFGDNAQDMVVVVGRIVGVFAILLGLLTAAISHWQLRTVERKANASEKPRDTQ